MLNKFSAIGFAGSDPESKTFDNGGSVASFSLATSESFTDKSGERVTNTEWHRLVVWNKQAEIIAKYVKKGSKIYVEGKVTYRKYADKDGIERNITEIVVSNFTFLDSKPSGDDSQSNHNSNANDSGVSSFKDKELTAEEEALAEQLPF